jgi:hypothetical protein
MFPRPTSTLAPLALALLACRPDASTRSPEASSPAPVHADARADVHDPPSHLLLPWGTALLTQPRTDAPALQLGLAEDASAGRAVAVVGREGDFWQIETLDAAALADFAAQPIEGLDVYRLHLYVPVGVGEPLRAIPPGPDEAPPPAPATAPPVDPASDDPEPETARAQAIAAAQEVGLLGALMLSGNPPVQTGESRSDASPTDFRVDPSTPVYWRDGQLAGEVRSVHAFVARGEPVASAAGELRCFAIRVGLAYELGDGELCFAAASVQEVAYAPEIEAGGLWGEVSGLEMAYDDDMIGGLIDTEIGDAWGEGGLGMVGTGVGGGGAGDGIGSIAIAEIDTSGRGVGGTIVGPASPTAITTQRSSGALDAEVGRRIVRAHTAELDACWAAHAGDGKQREVELSLELADDGSVTASTAKSKRSKLADCIEASSATWLFPEFVPGTLVVRIAF